ncbi:FGGY family carbohydrate kinase [Erwinia sp. Leaf53]|uniref:FGGY family carbohydrate kinase n=1 Tax=Erwinia sp. Leaf53 TaxID=1736225 RepID=UPI0009EC72F9|nr:FGGY family carbohydrate kinase [Erwinia sp. Leaf53]
MSPAAIAYKQLTPHPGWVEHDPLEILRNIRTCLNYCGVLDAIGLTHQGESVVAWDVQSRLPLYSAIIWQDQHTEKTVRQLMLFIESCYTMSLPEFHSRTPSGKPHCSFI